MFEINEMIMNQEENREIENVVIKKENLSPPQSPHQPVNLGIQKIQPFFEKLDQKRFWTCPKCPAKFSNFSQFAFHQNLRHLSHDDEDDEFLQLYWINPIQEPRPLEEAEVNERRDRLLTQLGSIPPQMPPQPPSSSSQRKPLKKINKDETELSSKNLLQSSSSANQNRGVEKSSTGGQKFNKIKIQLNPQPSSSSFLFEHKCAICERTYKHKKNLKCHVQKVHAHSDQVYEKCGKNFSSRQKMLKHQHNVHSNPRRRQNFQNGSQTKKRKVTRSGRKNEVSSSFTCVVCSKEFSRIFNLRRHIIEYHKESGKVQNLVGHHHPQVKRGRPFSTPEAAAKAARKQLVKLGQTMSSKMAAKNGGDENKQKLSKKIFKPSSSVGVGGRSAPKIEIKQEFQQKRDQTDDSLYSCSYCPQIFSHSLNLTRHIDCVHHKKKSCSPIGAVKIRKIQNDILRAALRKFVGSAKKKNGDGGNRNTSKLQNDKLLKKTDKSFDHRMGGGRRKLVIRLNQKKIVDKEFQPISKKERSESDENKNGHKKIAHEPKNQRRQGRKTKFSGTYKEDVKHPCPFCNNTYRSLPGLLRHKKNCRA